jgi:hypothetical protein
LTQSYKVSVAVALLLAVFGSSTPAGAVTVAVFEIEPAAEALIMPAALSVIVLAGGIVTVSLILPLPLAVKPEAPPL